MQDQASIRHRRQFQLEEGLFILLLGLSLLCIGITNFSPDDGYGYWLGMVLVFAVLAVIISWIQSKN